MRRSTTRENTYFNGDGKTLLLVYLRDTCYRLAKWMNGDTKREEWEDLEKEDFPLLLV